MASGSDPFRNDMWCDGMPPSRRLGIKAQHEVCFETKPKLMHVIFISEDAGWMKDRNRIHPAIHFQGLLSELDVLQLLIPRTNICSLNTTSGIHGLIGKVQLLR